jgi:ABC-type polysaccharide/polyol phosphate transport system ATPase subunit
MSTPLLVFDRVGKSYRIQPDRALALRFLRITGRAPSLVEAIRDLSFELRAGEAIGLYGPNGAGKTTALRIAAGVTTPTSGRVERRGRVVAVLGSAVALHPELSGIENLLLNGTLRGMRLAEIRARLDAIIDFAGLGDFIHAPVRTYSSGMCARLGFSLAFHTDFEIAIVDEALEVGDEDFKTRAIERMKRLTNEGKALLFASHGKKYKDLLGARVIRLEGGCGQAGRNA